MVVGGGFMGGFDAAGGFVAGPFLMLRAGAGGVIGLADPKRREEAAAAKGKGRAVEESVSAGYTAEMLAALQGAETTGAEAEKKGGKRRKA